MSTLFFALLAACTGDGASDSGSGNTTSDGGSSDGGTDDDGGTDGGSSSALDEQLATALAKLEAPPTPLQGADDQDPDLVALGAALFYDPILSGNKDVACASCHHPEHGTGDGLVLTLGTGATGAGPQRGEGEHGAWLARHAPPLFNVGEAGHQGWFWDGRVFGGDGVPGSAVLTLPDGLTSALAAQALHPIVDPGEMVGQPGDVAVDGSPNELADQDSPEGIWLAIMARLVAIDGYQSLLSAAYPATTEFGIQHVGNALAAYQSEAFQAIGTPWDAYLAGDATAISDSAKLGAVIFFGAAGCGNCHNGPLLTDGDFHNTGIPQLGPGVGDAAPYDLGRAGVTGDDGDRFAFKTPGLRNLSLTAPYMHDGVFTDAEDIVLHYADPAASAATYDSSGLPDDLAAMVHQDEEHLALLTAALSEDLPLKSDDAFVGLSNLRQFLLTLDDPAWEDASDLVPETVPSGLTVPR